MLVYVFSILAACANALSSVLQRKANKDLPADENLSPRLIADLLRTPLWFLGVSGIIAGFLLQAAALSAGPLAVVQPILIIELPLTLVLAGLVFGEPLHTREWIAIAAMTAGLAGLLYFLAPEAGTSRGLSIWAWFAGIGANLAIIGLLVAAARHRRATPVAASGLLGIATGASFGLTAALIKTVTDTFADHGFVAIFTTWQTYAMIVAGALAMFLLQSALNEGPLVAAQPGFTITDPIVSILWGVVVFHENVNSGAIHLLLAGLCALLLGSGVLWLSRSPQLERASKQK